MPQIISLLQKIKCIQQPCQVTEVENVVNSPETEKKLDWKKPDLDKEELISKISGDKMVEGAENYTHRAYVKRYLIG